MTAAAAAGDAEPIAIWLPLEVLRPAPDQPRKVFDEEKLTLLTESIRARGRIVQPLIARPLPGGVYEIVCGERRWRAAQAAGLTEAPVVVRDLNDQEAFEESLIENLDRADLELIDEVRAIARLAAEHGVQEAARRLGKPHSWVSKRKRIAEAQPFVLQFLEQGESSDVEALSDLARLADSDAAAAEAIVAEHAQGAGAHLRDQVKAAARAARREDDESDQGDPAAGESYGGAAALSEESFQLEDRAAMAAAGEEDAEDEDADRANDREKSDEPSWLPSDAPELDRPFDDHAAIVVTAVEARRAGHLVFTTASGEVTYDLTPLARDQLQALLR